MVQFRKINGKLRHYLIYPYFILVESNIKQLLNKNPKQNDNIIQLKLPTD